jgi:hypothetical protein
MWRLVYSTTVYVAGNLYRGYPAAVGFGNAQQRSLYRGLLCRRVLHRGARHFTEKPDVEVTVYILNGEGRYRRCAPVQFGIAQWLVRTKSDGHVLLVG